MIELRYNEDGKLEYRTQTMAYGLRGWEPYHELDNNVFRKVWNEWKIVPSEQTKSYNSGIVPKYSSSGVAWVHREAVDALERELEKAKRERDELKARVETLIKQRDCLSKQLESVSTPVAIWRRLEIGEIIKETDQYCLFSGGKWFPANSSSVGLPHNESQCEYRRCESALQPANSWLTEEEREHLQYFADGYRAVFRTREVVRKILARSSPPEVVLQPFKGEVTGGPWAVAAYNAAIVECREALAAAGIKVKE